MAEVNIHASCVAIGTNGVLLLGKSGAGKSDLALRLIDDGAELVADDRTILFGRNGVLYARAPSSIQGLLEIRGLGIVKYPTRPDVKVVLAVRLGKERTRLPHGRFFRPPQDLKIKAPIPEIVLNAQLAAAPAKVRAAVAAFSKDLFRDTFITK